MIQKILTIGVYGFDQRGFLQALQGARVDTLCDIRARRAVRGPLYTFANSERLQREMEELHIRYVHLKQLAPSQEIRDLQAESDKEAHIARRKRSELSDAFKDAYRQQCLKHLNAEKLLQHIPAEAAIIALLCVEREPEACHRSLVAEWLGQKLSLPIVHITP